MRGRARDGETGLFESAALMGFDAGGRKETRRACAAAASTPKKFKRNCFHYTVTTDFKRR